MVLKFKSVDIYHRVTGGTLITWRMVHPTPASTLFKIWCSRSGVGDWRLVGSVIDEMSFIDVTRQQYGVSPRVYYRVDAVSGSLTVSQVAHVGSTATTREQQLIAKEILRKEHMLMQKKTGTRGRLLKRKHWGPLCSCVDPDTAEPTDSYCLKCYGTGIADGYFTAVDYMMSFSANKQRQLKISDSTSVGTVESSGQPLTARSLICPRLDTGDVWINCITDERYIVGLVQELLYAGAPLLYGLVQLSLVPSSDVIYKLPVDFNPGGEAGRIIIDDGKLLLYDIELKGYYPVGIVGSSLSVFTSNLVTCRVEQNRLLLLNTLTGDYLAVGLSGGVLELYTTIADAPKVKIREGLLWLYDTLNNVYVRVGLVSGAFTVFAEDS